MLNSILLLRIKMRKELLQEIEIPEGVEISVEGNTLIVKGKEGENKKAFNTTNIVLEKKGNIIRVGAKRATKNEKKMINTIASHVKNMIKGTQKKYEYKLKACFSHFPISIEIKGKEALIKNFLGEKTPRKAKIYEGVDVQVDKDIITITSSNKESAGQTAANFETATRITKRDRRIFQDGIFMTIKSGEEI